MQKIVAEMKLAKKSESDDAYVANTTVAIPYTR